MIGKNAVKSGRMPSAFDSVLLLGLYATIESKHTADFSEGEIENFS